MTVRNKAQVKRSDTEFRRTQADMKHADVLARTFPLHNSRSLSKIFFVLVVPEGSFGCGRLHSFVRPRARNLRIQPPGCPFAISGPESQCRLDEQRQFCLVLLCYPLVGQQEVVHVARLPVPCLKARRMKDWDSFIRRCPEGGLA